MLRAGGCLEGRSSCLGKYVKGLDRVGAEGCWKGVAIQLQTSESIVASWKYYPVSYTALL